ncbi:MAG TPA: 50S ribosomal protein L20 [Gemmataceae bacterium]|jgi:large subunit ribosomal protein L20|nr:50S ribosomal protein L20 [Gemmataceae bacterium]
MVRAGSGKTLAQGRARTRKLTKGFRRGRHNLYRQSIVTLIRARRYAFRDRRVRKRQFRRLWIVRINAACRMRGIRYGQMINTLTNLDVGLNRKSLAEIAVRDPAAFDQIVALAKKVIDDADEKNKVRQKAEVDANKKAKAAAKA